jgi:hypothetical protein
MERDAGRDPFMRDRDDIDRSDGAVCSGGAATGDPGSLRTTEERQDATQRAIRDRSDLPERVPVPR